MARTSLAHILVAVVMAVAACSRGDGAGEATTETTADVPPADLAIVTHQAPVDTFWDLACIGADAGTR